MPSPAGPPAHLERFSREFCRLVVQFEGRLRAEVPKRSRVVDTPSLGVLIALETFGPIRPATIATLLAMTTGGASKVVDRIAEQGMVARRPGQVPDDRRAVVVVITAKGRRAIAAAERHLIAIGDQFVDAIDAMTGGARPTLDPTRPTGADQTLGLLYRFFALVDPVIVEAVGGAEVLNPNDPRGILVLLELDHRGALPLATISPLVDRSRAAGHQLVRRLRDLGLVDRRPDAADRRRLRLVPTPAGRSMARGIVRSVDTHMPELEPVLVELATALAAQRRAPTRDTTGGDHRQRSRRSPAGG